MCGEVAHRVASAEPAAVASNADRDNFVPGRIQCAHDRQRRAKRDIVLFGLSAEQQCDSYARVIGTSVRLLTRLLRHDLAPSLGEVFNMLGDDCSVRRVVALNNDCLMVPPALQLLDVGRSRTCPKSPLSRERSTT